MTETQTSGGTGDNFVVAGFRELGRQINRLTLRRQLRRHDTDRLAALTALGQRAWEQQVDLSAFAELRGQLLGLDARAAELSQSTSSLSDEKAALERERQAEAEKFDSRRRAVQNEKSPVDTKLREVRGRRAEADQTVKRAETRLSRIPAETAALDRDLAAATPPDQARQQAIQQKRSQLASEQAELGAKLETARRELPGLTAEEARLAGEVDRFAAQIAEIDAAQKATLGRLDDKLKQARSALDQTAQQARSVQSQRTGNFASLGKALYDSGSTPPALAEQAAAVAAVDRRRSETQAALDASLAISQSLPSGTMPKFWAVLATVLVVVAALVAGFGRSSSAGPAVGPATNAAPSVAVMSDSDADKARIVNRFVQSGNASDPALQADAVAILRQDILTIGGTANTVYLPILTKILRSDQADLRAAAADAIGMIGPTAAEIPALTRLLEDPAPDVVAAARRALASQEDAVR